MYVTGTVEINVSGGVINTYGGKEAIIAGSNFIDEITGTASVNITTGGENAPELNGIISKADDIKLNGADIDTSVIYVNDLAAGSDLAAGKVLGVNYYTDINAAEGAAEGRAAQMVIEAGSDVTYSEVTDAFTIVVSEETGKIALTLDGTITPDVSLDSLRVYLKQNIIVE